MTGALTLHCGWLEEGWHGRYHHEGWQYRAGAGGSSSGRGTAAGTSGVARGMSSVGPPCGRCRRLDDAHVVAWSVVRYTRVHGKCGWRWSIGWYLGIGGDTQPASFVAQPTAVAHCGRVQVHRMGKCSGSRALEASCAVAVPVLLSLHVSSAG
jgi:hypothetical protein